MHQLFLFKKKYLFYCFLKNKYYICTLIIKKIEIMNYDYDVLGLGNSDHPANQEQIEDLESEDLNECLDFAMNYDDFKPLLLAIELQTERLEIAKKLIDDLDSKLENKEHKCEIQKIKSYL